MTQHALDVPPKFKSPQALKVLDTYCANVQRQGSGRIQNKAAYLMSLIQSSKLGPAAGTPGSAQRLIERLSPPVRRAVDAVFDPVVDRVVLEDRALMELLAKVPEEQVRSTSTVLGQTAALQGDWASRIHSHVDFVVIYTHGFRTGFDHVFGVYSVRGTSCCVTKPAGVGMLSL